MKTAQLTTHGWFEQGFLWCESRIHRASECPGHHSCFSPLPLIHPPSFHLWPGLRKPGDIFPSFSTSLEHSCFWHLWALRQTYCTLYTKNCIEYFIGKSLRIRVLKRFKVLTLCYPNHKKISFWTFRHQDCLCPLKEIQHMHYVMSETFKITCTESVMQQYFISCCFILLGLFLWAVIQTASFQHSFNQEANMAQNIHFLPLKKNISVFVWFFCLQEFSFVKDSCT